MGRDQLLRANEDLKRRRAELPDRPRDIGTIDAGAIARAPEAARDYDAAPVATDYAKADPPPRTT